MRFLSKMETSAAFSEKRVPGTPNDLTFTKSVQKSGINDFSVKTVRFSADLSRVAVATALKVLKTRTLSGPQYRPEPVISDPLLTAV